MTSVSSRKTGRASCSSAFRARLPVPSDNVSTVITGEIKGKGNRVRDSFRPADAVGV